MLSNLGVLLVDLNKFARYPTISIGYLTAVLRRAGHRVSVFAPLMIGVKGVSRERPPHALSLPVAQLNYYIATSQLAPVRRARDWLAAARRSEITAQSASVVRAFADLMARERPQAVMISTYLAYRDVCTEICALCADTGVPVVIGGPYFANRDVLQEWVRIPGLRAVIAGELEADAPAILEALAGAANPVEIEGVVDLDEFGNLRGTIARPKHDLDSLPFPDYSDFPWSADLNRIVPIITGRGCGWGVCKFCSDVTSTAGRTFRSRSPANVLEEIAHHHARYGASLFVFTDLKLNSDPAMWRALLSGMGRAAPGSHWIASVHTGIAEDAALSRADLHAAAASGCVRLTTGLETGSQRVANAMVKGTSIETLQQFLHDAHAAGISCRATMIIGFPGEVAADVHASADFLEHSLGTIERVSLNRLQIVAGTSLHDQLLRRPARFPGVTIRRTDSAQALVEHYNEGVHEPRHRLAAMRLLRVVQTINSRPLSARAVAFEGAM